MSRALLSGAALVLLFAAQSADAREGKTKNVLIVYGSYAGSTAEIADSMKAALGRAGYSAHAVPASGSATDLSPYDLVVIGSAIHGGRVNEKVTAFVRANRAALAEKPLAVFATCATITSSMANRRKAAEAYPDKVAFGLPVVGRAVFAGKMPPSGRIGTLMGKLILGITPGDYRDWKRIEAWAVSLPGLSRQAEAK